MPIVSVIVPCYNEETTIRLLLESLLLQSFPRSDMEIVIADGMSTDKTIVQIQAFQTEHPDLMVRIVKNERRNIPAGLNLAIEAAQGEFIVRLDAHSMPKQDYIERCLGDLRQGLGENVGGVWEIEPGGSGWIAKSIALAAAHPLGVGDARYRYADQAGVTDTVPFGSFRRSLINEIGPFDETLLTNEDYEFNARIRMTGGKVWLDPGIRSVYFARSTLTALGRQYWRYGYWKVRMLRRYPGTIRWRQVLPPVFTASLLFLGLLAPWLSLAVWIFAIEVVLYLTALAIAGIHQAVIHRQFNLMFGIPLAIMVMHLSWGSAFLWSSIR